MDACLEWLLSDDNPAVKYRTQTEILGVPADKTPVRAWLNAFLPDSWTNSQGLWFRYYITAFAECALTYEDIPLSKPEIIGFGRAFPFECSCADFMHLRALARLGLAEEPEVSEIFDEMNERALPDGGFLCLHRLEKLNRVPKSCVKAATHALLLCAECKKRGVSLKIEPMLLEYFWKHRVFYRTDDPDALILNAREGWRAIDAFYPFELMRVGVQNIVEAFCALGYGGDARLEEATNFLNRACDREGRVTLGGTLSKSYLPKEKRGQPSRWATFYARLARAESPIR